MHQKLEMSRLARHDKGTSIAAPMILPLNSS